MTEDRGKQTFGIGADHDQSFWTSIQVVRPLKIAWDLAKDYCQASWSSAAQSSLPCPDPSENTQNGFINRHDQPRLENGSRFPWTTGPALVLGDSGPVAQGTLEEVRGAETLEAVFIRAVGEEGAAPVGLSWLGGGS